MMDTVFNYLFRCQHRNLSRPMSPAGSRPIVETASTYVVCLDCGKHFAYDWEEMRIGAPQPVAGAYAAPPKIV